MAIRAVFFDLDDTLCNTSGSRQERALIAARLLAECEPALVVDDLVSRILSPVSDDGWPRGVASVLVELGLSLAPHGIRAHNAWFFEGCEHLIRPFDGCDDTLALLSHQYKLGVITNGLAERQRRKYDALRLAEHLQPELFLPSEVVGYDKPDARIFRHALKLAGVEPAEAVMVGDWLSVDVIGAQDAGLHGIWFNPHDRSVPEGIVPDAVVRSMAELPEVLRTLGSASSAPA